jgi:hypothetical protein
LIGQGRTAFALGSAVHAVEVGQPVVFFSMEDIGAMRRTDGV